MTAVLESVRDDRAAVDKAFSLLVAFGDEASTGVGVRELARRASLSKTTAHRLLGMLERNAMVERIGTSYRLGPRLHELGLAVYPRSHERVRDQRMRSRTMPWSQVLALSLTVPRMRMTLSISRGRGLSDVML